MTCLCSAYELSNYNITGSINQSLLLSTPYNQLTTTATSSCAVIICCKAAGLSATSRSSSVGGGTPKPAQYCLWGAPMSAAVRGCEPASSAVAAYVRYHRNLTYLVAAACAQIRQTTVNPTDPVMYLRTVYPTHIPEYGDADSLCSCITLRHPDPVNRCLWNWLYYRLCAGGYYARCNW